MTQSSPPESGQSKPPLESVHCNYCGQDDTILRFPDTRPDFSVNGDWTAFSCTNPGYGVHPPIVECTNCGLVYTNPRPMQTAVVDKYESVEDPVYLAERAARERTFRHHLRRLETFTGPAKGRRLLDVGAYIGVFVETANASDWDAHGVEPSFWAVQHAQQAGLQIQQAMLANAPYEPASFDVLTMWDVIEHLTDPLTDLQHAYDLLKPGGWIAVHTMDLDSLFARFMRDRWPWLMEMHLYYFTRRSLAEMLEKAGFEVKVVRPEHRYLSLTYLMSRLRPYSSTLADVIEWAARLLHLDRMLVPVNFGDLVTAYARKPDN